MESFFFLQEVTIRKQSRKCGQNGGKERAKHKMKKEVERKIKHKGFHCVLTLGLSSDFLSHALQEDAGAASGLIPGKTLLYSAQSGVFNTL